MFSLDSRSGKSIFFIEQGFLDLLDKVLMCTDKNFMYYISFKK